MQGNTFYFGGANGEPLTFVATEVSNNRRAQGGIFANKFMTTLVLSAVVQDRDMAALRDAVSKKRIDAVRVVLANNVRIDKSVDEKNGEKMRDKFACFYQALDKKGINLLATAATGITSAPMTPGGTASVFSEDALATLAAAAGRYNRRTTVSFRQACVAPPNSGIIFREQAQDRRSADFQPPRNLRFADSCEK